MYKPQKYYVEQKKPDIKVHTVGLNYYKSLEKRNLIEGSKSRTVIAWDWGGIGCMSIDEEGLHRNSVW